MPEIVLLLPIAAVLGLVLYLAYGLRGLLPARARQVERFAARHGLQPTPAGTDHLRQQLTRGARLRVVAVICVAVTVGLQSGGGLDLQVVLAAVVAGTLLTELTLARPAPSPTRSASLRPRELPAYLSRPLLWGPAAAGAAAALAWACVPALGADTDGWTKPSDVRVAVGILLALAVPPAAAAACRWIVQRPQPLVGADLVAADDALRTASVRRIAAVACVMGLLGFVDALGAMIGSAHGAGRWLVGLVMLAALGLAVAAWRSRQLGPPHRRRSPAVPA